MLADIFFIEFLNIVFYIQLNQTECNSFPFELAGDQIQPQSWSKQTAHKIHLPVINR